MLAGAAGALANTSSITLNQGGTLFLDNSAANNNDRLADGAALTLTGGRSGTSSGRGTSAAMCPCAGSPS